MEKILSLELPTDCKQAAHWWHEFGLSVAPMNPTTKYTRLHWQPWLDRVANDGHAAIEAEFRPDDEVCAIVDDRLFILDADTPMAVAALQELEQAFDVFPNLVVKTAHGEHHYFRKEAGCYACLAGYSSKAHPDRIDVRTARGAKEGRSVIVLPPSSGREVVLNEADNTGDLVQVGQAFIDAVFRHNGQEAPRPRDLSRPVADRGPVKPNEVSEILSYIDPSCGYSDWFTVLSGVHDKFMGSMDGFEIVDDWSVKGSNYCGREELEYKWQTFVPGRGVTFASVAKMAEQEGANLSEIAKSYDTKGKKVRSFADLLDAARALDADSCPDVVDAIVMDAARLKPTAKRQVFNAIKEHAKIPLSTLKETEQAMAGDESTDDLAHARALADEIGRDSVLAASTFVWRWMPHGVWHRQEDRAVKQLVQAHLGENVDGVRKSVVDSVADLFRTEIYRPELEFNRGPAECVNCPTGELMLSGNGWRLEPHNREHYRTTQVPVTFDPDATAPRFQQFLAEVFKGDDDSDQKAQALLEVMGYSLMAHCNYEQFVILVGAGANGKSVLLAVLEALAGSANVAGVQPSNFGSAFQRAHLHGKLVNIVTEIKQGEVIDDASLKGIVSGEPTTVEHKHRDPFEMRPFSTCWFGTNHMPHTRDFSDGLFRRALVVEFNNKFKPELGNCDPLLREKLMAELPGILNLALNAYAGVVSRGCFTLPESCKQARNRWRTEADQVAQFIEDECTHDPVGRIEPKRLFQAYRQWADECGIHKTLGLRAFADRVVALGFERYRSGGGRYITGLDCRRANMM